MSPDNQNVCELCGKEFKNAAGLATHKRLAHSEVPSVVTSKPEVKEKVALSASDANPAIEEKMEALRRYVVVSLNDPKLLEQFKQICSGKFYRVLIPREQGEPENSRSKYMIGLNGVRFEFPKMEYIELPECLCQIMDQALGVSTKYMKAYEISSENPLGKNLDQG